MSSVHRWKQDQGPGLFLPDGHSGSRQVIDPATGVVIRVQRFDAFGVTMTTAGTYATPIGYRGGRLDAVTNWYDFRARPYDALRGRFLAEDPVTWTYNDPLRHWLVSIENQDGVGNTVMCKNSVRRKSGTDRWFQPADAEAAVMGSRDG